MAPTRALVIFNPAARHGDNTRLLAAMRELLDAAFPNTLVATTSPGHACDVAAQAHAYDVVVAAGGDGTVHEALNGIMRLPAEDRPALTALPIGSGNDWARTIGMPRDLAAAVGAVAACERRRIDIGLCNRTYFANSVAVGLDARVTAKAVELKITTGRTGVPLYLSALLHVLFREFYAHHVRLGFDDESPADRDMLLLAATIGATYGGGFHITPDAMPDDGLLETCLLDVVSLPSALWRMPFFIPGWHTWMRPIHMARHTSVLVESDAPLPGQIDGEVVMSCSYDVRVLPAEIEVIAPRRP